jgi:hypothetical protein
LYDYLKGGVTVAKRQLELKHGIYQGKLPLIYLKVLNNNVSVYLTPGDHYLFSKNTIEEVAAHLDELVKLKKTDEKKFWETIMFKYTVMPIRLLGAQKKAFTTSSNNKDDDEREKWFRGAWFTGTFEFFDKYPKFEWYDEVPVALIKEIMYGPEKAKQEPKKSELTKSSKVEDSVKAEDKPVKKQLSIKDKIKKKKSKSSNDDVSSSKGKDKPNKKDVLSRLKKKKKASKV